ncbi:MMPL family protein, partial [Vibrio parahaemolyticus AQ3810]
SCLF